MAFLGDNVLNLQPKVLPFLGNFFNEPTKSSLIGDKSPNLVTLVSNIYASYTNKYIMIKIILSSVARKTTKTLTKKSTRKRTVRCKCKLVRLIENENNAKLV